MATRDDYEDVAGGLYRPMMLPVLPEAGEQPVDALVYRMTATHEVPQEPGCLATVTLGYRNFRYR